MKYITILICLLFVSAFSTAQKAAPGLLSVKKEKQFTNHTISLIENKGQITDQSGNPRHDIQFKTGSNGISVFIGNGQLHYQFYKAEKKVTAYKPQDHLHNKKIAQPDTAALQYNMYRLDMALEGANPNAHIVTEDKQSYYESYHTVALHTDNACACAYNKVTYKNIYPNIDWTLYIKDNKLEYDFIIHPGGNVNDIKIKYDGATDIAHTNGNIKVRTPMGSVTEQQLYAYEQATHKPVAAGFKLKNNTLAFSLPSLRGVKQTTYVIDPTLAWGTYYDGTGIDEAMGTVCDRFGNVYITGSTSSVSNIATIGAYQTTYKGSYDVFLSKFTGNTSAIQWATYYGGSNVEYGNALTCDNAGYIYVTGTTASSDNIATNGAHQTVSNGGYMVFLASFNPAGVLQWGTYYGGGVHGVNWGFGLTNDGTNVYVCGYTSSADSIATIGSYQDSLGGSDNTNDAFLAKFNKAGVLLWGTYFGYGRAGNGNVAFACACDAVGNVYITGEAYDSSTVITPGCYQDSFRGGSECFVSKFDSACHLIWSTYYGGDSGQLAQAIVCDSSSNVFITGITFSTDYIATPGAHQSVYGGGYNDAFLAKFNDAGALQWATYYGGANDEEAEGVTCDPNGNIYITGFTGSTNDIATPGSYSNTYMGGSYDAYLAKFSTSGSLLWATYYGGSNGDAAYGVACDVVGSVYMAGATTSFSDIATAGAYQPDFSDSTDAFLVKFDTGVTNVTMMPSLFNSLSLYPSPNTGDFNIIGKLADPNSDTSISIEILNVAGEIVYKDNAMLRSGQLNKHISINNAVSGSYLMRLNSGDNQKAIKFIIQQ